MTQQRIKGIFFDLGDTILDFGQVDVPAIFLTSARLAYEYLGSLNQPLPPFARFHRRQLWAIRWRYALSRITRREFNALDVTDRLGRRMGHKLSREQNLELTRLWYKPLSEQATVEEGTVDMFRALRRDGLQLGVVSNTFIPPEVLDEHLERENLLELLSPRVYSSAVGCRKPARRIFELAMAQAGLTPDETLFVGDSLRGDIRGANRAGMISVLKDPAGRHAKSLIKPRYRIRSLLELPAIVARHNGAR
jgi:putative hydrolase of the HAD superfamily